MMRQRLEEMLARDAEQLYGDPNDKNSLKMDVIRGMADIVVTNTFDDSFTEEAVAALRRHVR